MHRRSIGLPGRIFFILLLSLATEFAVNTFLFERAGQYALQEDDAQRMVEHLVVARRVLDRTPVPQRATAAKELSTHGFIIVWSAKVRAIPTNFQLDNLRAQALDLQPDLARANLRLYLLPLTKGGAIAGTMDLPDGSVVKFRTYQRSIFLPHTFSRILALIAPTLVLVLLGGLMILATLRPLRVLMRATNHVGTNDHGPVPEDGPTEVRLLIHAFNAMQIRIHRLINSRTQALAAVGHDLRTPLARMQLRLDAAEMDRVSREAVTQDIEEMDQLLQSLQIYLSGEGMGQPPERMDIAAMAATLIDSARDAGRDAEYTGPDNLEIVARPVAIRRALSNLVDNALHYAGSAHAIVSESDNAITIAIEDDGPGIAPNQLEEVMQPFVRLDDARARNTRGMGLGLAIVSDAIRAEGGHFSLVNRAEGGLRATLILPRVRKDDI